MVTGAAGFIGFALADKLSRQSGMNLIVVDNFVRGESDGAYAELCARSSVSPYQIDLTDAAQVAQLPDTCEVIFHLAALNGTQNFYERPYEVVRCSTLPTFHLLDRYGPTGKLKRFVYAGSSEAYSCTVKQFGWQVPTDETVPLSISDPSNRRWSYGASKLHGEILVTNACRQFDSEYTIIRYHNAYGPRMGDKHVVPDFLERMNHGKYELYGYEDTRSFIYIDDAVRATLALAECKAAANETVNVGSDNEMKILDLGQKILDLAGINAEIELHASPAGSVPRRSPDISKLRKLINFNEEWTLDRGLEETMKFYLK